jgi:hypothetical protein
MTLTIATSMGGGVQEVQGGRVGVKRSKEFEVNKFASIEVLKVFGKGENSAYAAGKIA